MRPRHQHTRPLLRPGLSMESRSKKLRQERASLGAQQGDPDAPAGGTLFGRKARLQAELDRAQSDEAPLASAATPSASSTLVGAVHGRSIRTIERDMRLIEAEIETVTRRIAE